MTPDDRLEWRTPSFSGNGENCVQVAPDRGWRTGQGADGVTSSGAVYLRHSKHPDAGTITFSLSSWTAFLGEVHAGSVSNNGVVKVTGDEGGVLVDAVSSDVSLRFDEGEWNAFIAGNEAGEFDVTRFA
ncbi:DUF397 domain-containing protein [Nocardia brasiliensis]|uniref:DUF397 domain-containing protein n=1 Tax=Nocardia brasiliensis TaxID=37326 RepID=UPI0036713D77